MVYLGLDQTILWDVMNGLRELRLLYIIIVAVKFNYDLVYGFVINFFNHPLDVSFYLLLICLFYILLLSVYQLGWNSIFCLALLFPTHNTFLIVILPHASTASFFILEVSHDLQAAIKLYVLTLIKGLLFQP